MFVTPQIRDVWSDIARLNDAETFIVPNTTKEDDAQKVLAIGRDELRQSLDLPKDAFIVSCIAKVDVSKGQDVLIKALPDMVQTVPELHVVFVGPMTPYGAHLPGEIDSMGLTRHVSFVGGRDDAYSFIRASDMLIHPSRAEGQGLVVLEAMILKTPIIATDVGGIPFAVDHGRSGWLVPPDDPPAIALAFMTLARNPELMQRLTLVAEDRYWKDFSRRKHRERVQFVLDSCLANASSKASS